MVFTFPGNVLNANNTVQAYETSVVTLYSTSPVIKNARIHIATFDSDVSFRFNWTNCNTIANLWNKQYTLNYWCEKGYFKE